MSSFSDEGRCPSIKSVLLGASCIGAKSSLLVRFVTGKFSGDLEATIGAAFMMKQINVRGVDVRLEMWGL